MSRWGGDHVWLLPHRLIFPFGARLETGSEVGVGQFFSRKTTPFMPLTRGNTRLQSISKANNERFSTPLGTPGGAHKYIKGE